MKKMLVSLTTREGVTSNAYVSAYTPAALSYSRPSTSAEVST